MGLFSKLKERKQIKKFVKNELADMGKGNPKGPKGTKGFVDGR